MFNLFKSLFHDPNRESIEIFERETRLKYEKSLFRSFTVLSITHTPLKNLQPFAPFKNLEILNLSHNKISNIEPLRELKKLKIIDLRFNQLSHLPSWLFVHHQPLYWAREEEDQEGIFLQGNPLPKKIIQRLKDNRPSLADSTSDASSVATTPSREESLPPPPQLYPLNTQRLVVLSAQHAPSHFVNHLGDHPFILHPHTKLRLNLDLLYYDRGEKILPSSNSPAEVNYLLLVLKATHCCVRPLILSHIKQRYPQAQIFLVMESDSEDIEAKIEFFKSYDQHHNIVHIFHSFDTKSNEKIVDALFLHLRNTPEVNSLWEASWLMLKKAIEEEPSMHPLTPTVYQKLSQKYQINPSVSTMLWDYLIRVGTIHPAPAPKTPHSSQKEKISSVV